MPVPSDNIRSLLLSKLPDNIFIDTTIFVFALSGIKKQDKDKDKKVACNIFIRRLVDSKTNIYVSALLFLEFYHAILLNEVIKHYEAKSSIIDEREALKKIKKEKNLITLLMPQVEIAINDLVQLMIIFKKWEKEPRFYVVESAQKLMKKTTETMLEHNLDSYDAFHLACMLMAQPDFKDFASLDYDYFYDPNRTYCLWCGGITQAAIKKYEDAEKKRITIENGKVVLSKR